MAVWRGMTQDQPPLAWMAVRLWNTWLQVWNWYALASRPVPVHTETVSGPYFSVQLVVLLHDDVVRLVPRDALPFVRLAAEGAVALHGIQQAVLVIQVFGKRQAADAQAAVRDGLVGVALDLDQLPVLDEGPQATAHAVAPRRRPLSRAVHFGAVFKFRDARRFRNSGQLAHSACSSLVLLFVTRKSQFRRRRRPCHLLKSMKSTCRRKRARVPASYGTLCNPEY